MRAPRLRQGRVKDVNTLGAGLREIRMSMLDGPIPYQAGQWLAFRIADGEEKGIWRAYSFSSAPEESENPDSPEEFRVLVDTHAGDAAEQRFESVSPGDELIFHGPYGVFNARDNAPSRAVLVASGVGIGPIRGLLRSLMPEGRTEFPITLVQQAAVPHGLAYRRQFESWEQEIRGFTYVPTVPGGESDWHGESREPRDLIPALFPDVETRKKAHWYICGLPDETEELRSWLSQNGSAPGTIRVERLTV